MDTTARVTRVAVPVATLVVTICLEVFEAPVLSVLAGLRVAQALTDLQREPRRG